MSDNAGNRGSRTAQCERAANNQASVRLSIRRGGDSVQTTIAGVDPNDNAETYGDQQPFTVGGGPPGAAFDVRVSGGSGTPFVFFTLGTDTDRECLKPAGSDHHCVTSAGTVLPLSGTVRASILVRELHSRTVVARAERRTPATRSRSRPSKLRGDVRDGQRRARLDRHATERRQDHRYDRADLQRDPQGALILVGLTEQVGSPVYATVTSCTTNGGGNKISNVVWNRPWTLP